MALARTVVVVPGTAALIDGRYRLTAEAIGRLRRAERIAATGSVQAVIVSGWSGPDGQGVSEAQQLRDAWAGPPVPVIVDAQARTTAENALCAAHLIATGHGPLGHPRPDRVIVVASWANALRLLLAFHAAFRPLRKPRLRVRAAVCWGRGHGASWRPGLKGIWWLPRHLAAGRAMLTHGPDHPLADTSTSRRRLRRQLRRRRTH